MADVHFMVGQPGRTQRLPGHRVRNFTKRRGGNYQKTAKTKQSRRWPGDNLPSAAAAAAGLRTPLCAALTSTPRASSRRSSIINANEAEGAEGRGGGRGGRGGGVLFSPSRGREGRYYRASNQARQATPTRTAMTLEPGCRIRRKKKKSTCFNPKAEFLYQLLLMPHSATGRSERQRLCLIRPLTSFSRRSHK